MMIIMLSFLDGHTKGMYAPGKVISITSGLLKLQKK